MAHKWFVPKLKHHVTQSVLHGKKRIFNKSSPASRYPLWMNMSRVWGEHRSLNCNRRETLRRSRRIECMPELPDLEVLKERLHTLVGDSITSVDIQFPLTFRIMVEGHPEDVLSTKKVQHITRRGKFLIFELDIYFLAFNLMLTGRLQLTDQLKNPRNTRVVITFDSGRYLKFIDFKKMGKIYVTDDLEKIPQYSELGIEPFSEQFSREQVSRLLNDQREIKIVLTDQKKIAGIGNAYSDEILFHARINPRRRADSLTNEDISILYDSIHYILKNALLEIRKADTYEEVRDFFLIHGKKGQSCPVCQSVIREIEVSKRVTHVCPQCQHMEFPL
jgi:formamidopyrimidine-DNA glycosylase